jgi:hypothetical protein
LRLGLFFLTEERKMKKQSYQEYQKQQQQYNERVKQVTLELLNTREMSQTVPDDRSEALDVCMFDLWLIGWFNEEHPLPYTCAAHFVTETIGDTWKPDISYREWAEATISKLGLSQEED